MAIFNSYVSLQGGIQTCGRKERSVKRHFLVNNEVVYPSLGPHIMSASERWQASHSMIYI